MPATIPLKRPPERFFHDGQAVRLAARSGRFVEHTSGIAPGYVQGNLVILPREAADEFLRFCQRNPKPCPLLAVSEPGDPTLPALGADLDIRTDLPRYRVWRDGELAEEPVSVGHLWGDDLVSFVIGCSFTFEEALLADGIPLRHVACGENVAMYRTTIATEPAGRFHGPLVVSMRPLRPADAIRAVQITSRYPAVHGAPVHLGHPDAIGIVDLARPDYGAAVPVAADELPVFWACGVTPQAAIAAARVPFAITHAPGYMLVTDRRNRDYAIL
ncbi:MAG: putative hydro-lyase [Methylobacteriaceae bacterium]|nr:putative hydro-lyase [Methylobacteriaceae bacterium]